MTSGAEPSPTVVKILVRGDSQGTSLGEGTVDARDPRLWPHVLERELRSRGHDVEVRNASTAGLRIDRARRERRTDPLIAAAFADADVVVVALGINDWWPLARPQAVADWMDRARPLLLRRAMRKAYKRVRPQLLRATRGRLRPTPAHEARRSLLGLVADLRRTGHAVALVTPFPVRSPVDPLLDGNTDEAADAVVSVAREAGVAVVDCRDVLAPIEWETISIDHIHVGEPGQELVAAAVADALETAGAIRAREVAPPHGDQPGVRPAGDPAVATVEGVRARPGCVLLRGDAAGALSAPDLIDALRSELGEDDVVAALGQAFDVHGELLRAEHDPLVREAVEACGVVVLDPTPARGGRPTAWDRERFDQLVAGLRRRAPVVLVDTGGGWGAAARAAAARALDTGAEGGVSAAHDVVVAAPDELAAAAARCRAVAAG